MLEQLHLGEDMTVFVKTELCILLKRVIITKKKTSLNCQ